MNRLLASCVLIAALLLASPPASAQLPTRQVSITVSPLHLLTPVLEVTGEFMLAPNLGVAGILGTGTIEVSGSSSDAFVYEVGAQGRFYALGDFDSGLHFGVEALYVGVALDSDGVTATGSGLSLGGFGGYKHTFGAGFVLEGQLGYAYTLLAATASGGGGYASDSDTRGGVLLNLNLGWAF